MGAAFFRRLERESFVPEALNAQAVHQAHKQLYPVTPGISTLYGSDV
jgi:hypothetical protein